MLPDGGLVPWQSPGGVPIRLAAAVPQFAWSDLAQALTDNGRASDAPPRRAAAGAARTPYGVEKQSYSPPSTPTGRPPPNMPGRGSDRRPARLVCRDQRGRTFRANRSAGRPGAHQLRNLPVGVLPAGAAARRAGPGVRCAGADRSAVPRHPVAADGATSSPPPTPVTRCGPRWATWATLTRRTLMAVGVGQRRGQHVPVGGPGGPAAAAAPVQPDHGRLPARAAGHHLPRRPRSPRWAPGWLRLHLRPARRRWSATPTRCPGPRRSRPTRSPAGCRYHRRLPGDGHDHRSRRGRLDLVTADPGHPGRRAIGPGDRQLNGTDTELAARLWDVDPATGKQALITRAVYRLTAPADRPGETAEVRALAGLLGSRGRPSARSWSSPPTTLPPGAPITCPPMTLANVSLTLPVRAR